MVYSHADEDHVWGTCGLSPLEVIAHEECAKRFADPKDVAGTLEKYRRKFRNELQSIELIPPTRTFQSDMTVDLGGVTVELHHCPGHTKDSILAIVPELGLLLGGDCIETPLPLLNEGTDYFASWIDSLSRLERDSRIKTCIPSHGRIGGPEILRHNISYLDSLLDDETHPSQEIDKFYATAHLENRSKTAALRSKGC